MDNIRINVGTSTQNHFDAEDQENKSNIQSYLEDTQCHREYTEAEKDIATRKIQDVYNRRLAGNTFKQTSAYTNKNVPGVIEYNENDPGIIAYENMQKISMQNIKDIIQELGGGKNFSLEEKKIISKFLNLPTARLQHQSLSTLRDSSKLSIRSSRLLKQEGCHTAYSNVPRRGIEGLNNDDFVFCAVDFSGRKLSKKPIMNKHGVRYYGYKAYLVEEKKGKYGYLTLTNQLNQKVKVRFILKQQEIFSKYKIEPRYVVSKMERKITDNENNVPIFANKDMRLAIALYTIKFLRESVDEINKNPFQKLFIDGSYEEISYMLHTLFNLEYHIPKRITAREDDYSYFKIENCYDFEKYITRVNPPSKFKIFINKVKKLFSYKISS